MISWEQAEKKPQKFLKDRLQAIILAISDLFALFPAIFVPWS